MEDDKPESLIYVAITGALAEPRAKVTELINATANGRFVEILTLKTHYLVCTKHDSNKAKKAARVGTTVISEAELKQYLAVGSFPSTALPSYRPRQNVQRTSDTEWHPKGTPEVCLLTYCDARGDGSIRRILWTHDGRTQEGGIEWLGGYDGPQFKTWRVDRVIELEILQGETSEWLRAASVDA